MSLQVWLPLNGDLKNYGVANVTTTAASGITYVDGKIGKCANAASSVSITATVPNLSTMLANGKTYSLACWVKIKSVGANGWAVKLGTNTCGLWWGYSSARWAWNENDYGKRCANETISANTEWHHLVTTVDKTVTNQITTKHYVDGVPAADYPSDTWNSSGQAQPADNTITITPYVAMLNDIRLYDEILSPKQVKEISKALIVHYPLNDQYNSSVLNKYSGTYAEGNATTVEASLTKTKLAEERGYNFKGTYTGTGSSHYARLQWPTYTFTAGKVYFYSVKIRCHKWSSGSFVLRAARSSNDYGTGMTGITVCQPSLADDQWHEYYVSQTINETYERGGSTVTCNPLFEFYSSNQNGNSTVYEMDFDLKDIQVVESDTYIPFIKNEFASATVFDTSGFMNNGTATGLTYTSDSPRYSISSLFGSNRGIFCDKTTVPRVDGEPLTVSCWFKQLGRSGYQDIVSNRASSSFNWLLYTHSTDGSIQFHGANQNKSTVIPSLNEWHHVVAVVYTNSTYSLFLDGSKVVNAASYTYRVATSVGICIGKYGNLTTFTEPFNGYISDVRIYATALSDADIKELYQTSASFDNLGNIHVYEISENL